MKTVAPVTEGIEELLFFIYQNCSSAHHWLVHVDTASEQTCAFSVTPAAERAVL